jgi:hypothetical protein
LGRRNIVSGTVLHALTSLGTQAAGESRDEG